MHPRFCEQLARRAFEDLSTPCFNHESERNAWDTLRMKWAKKVHELFRDDNASADDLLSFGSEDWTLRTRRGELPLLRELDQNLERLLSISIRSFDSCMIHAYSPSHYRITLGDTRTEYIEAWEIWALQTLAATLGLSRTYQFLFDRTNMFSPIAFGGCIVFGINSPNFMHNGFGEVLRYTFDADTPPRVAHAKHVKLGFRKGSSYPDSTKFFLRDKVGFFKHVYDSFKAHVNVPLIKPRLLFRDDHEGVLPRSAMTSAERVIRGHPNSWLQRRRHAKASTSNANQLMEIQNKLFDVRGDIKDGAYLDLQNTLRKMWIGGDGDKENVNERGPPVFPARV